MPRPVAWLLLILAFAGPLLVHAEAAEDLERFLIESGDRCEIEPPDGGVGDTPVEVSAWRVGPTADSPHFDIPALDTSATSSPHGLLSRDPRLGRRRGPGPLRPHPTTPRRHALLEHFLI